MGRPKRDGRRKDLLLVRKVVREMAFEYGYQISEQCIDVMEEHLRQQLERRFGRLKEKYATHYLRLQREHAAYLGGTPPPTEKRWRV